MAKELTVRIQRVVTTTALEAAAQYTAGDVLSNSDTGGAGVAWTFSKMGNTNGRGGYITKAIVISETESITPQLSLYLFNKVPTCELDDNEAAVLPIHADFANFVGVINFISMTSQGDESFAVATPSTADQIPLGYKCAVADDDLYGVLVTEDTFTQTGGDDMTVILIIEQH